MAGNPDPQIKSLLNKIQEAGAPPLNALTPAQARETKNPAFIEFGGHAVDVANVANLRIPGPAGEIPIRVYTPEGKGPFPVLVYFHGGGWVICNLDTHDSLCRHIVNRASCAVVSVDYRLAPEYKFPAAADDAFAATRWIAENGGDINVDPARIAAGGDSAGGNLAAVVSLMAKDRGGPDLSFQLLVYPVADLSTMDNATYREHGEAYILTRDSMAYYGGHYLARKEDALNPLCLPPAGPRPERASPGPGNHGRTGRAYARGRGLRKSLAGCRRSCGLQLL